MGVWRDGVLDQNLGTGQPVSGAPFSIQGLPGSKPDSLAVGIRDLTSLFSTTPTIGLLPKTGKSEVTLNTDC